MKKSILFTFLLFFLLTVTPVYADEASDKNPEELLKQLEGLNGETVKKSDFQDGMNAYLRRDYRTAFRVFRSLSDQGDAMAQLHLGEMYEMGWGVTRDYVKAAEWYLKASEQGEFRASEQLSKMYREGHGVPKNGAKAQKWAQKARQHKKNRAVQLLRRDAGLGKAYAQFKLGEMYVKGKGRSAG